MEKMLPGRDSFRTSRLHRVCAVGMSVLFVGLLSGTALGQQIAVSGTVTSAAGNPLRGVSVRVQGADTRAFTNATGLLTPKSDNPGPTARVEAHASPTQANATSRIRGTL